MVHVGDRALLVTGGRSAFELDEDGYALVESATDAPGRNPFTDRPHPNR